MSEEKLIDALGEIDCDLIEAADKCRNVPREIKLPKTKALAAVACFIITFALAVVTARFMSESLGIVPDGIENEENIPADGELTVGEAFTELATDPSDGASIGNEETVPTAQGAVTSADNDGASAETGGGVSDGAIPETADTPKVTEALSVEEGRVILYNGLSLPQNPHKINSYAIRYTNGAYSGKNISYTDNAVILDSDSGLLFSFCIYQDSLDYTAELLDLLAGCVTMDYENNTFDRLDRANECITVSVNGEPAKISQVSYGQGNGHIDYYLTVTASDGGIITLSDVSDIIVDIVRPDSDKADTPANDGSSSAEDGEVTPAVSLVIPRITLDDSFSIPEESIGYFNYGHRTYILWQELHSNTDTGPELFKVKNTLTEKPYDFYEEYGGNMNASISAVTGFNTDFALAANINGKSYICICLNDITLYSARDIFCDRFGLDRLYNRSAYELTQCRSVTVFTEEEMHSDVYERFMTALFDSEFTQRSKLLMTRLATVHFMTDSGIRLSVNLYKGGYATLSNVNDFANIMFKLDTDAFDSFIESLGEREFDADNFASFVTSTDRSLMFVSKPLDSLSNEKAIYFFDDESSLFPLIFYTVDGGNTVKPIEYTLSSPPASGIKEVGSVHTSTGDGYEFGFFIELILNDGSTVYASFNNYENANMYEWTKFNFIGYTSEI